MADRALPTVLIVGASRGIGESIAKLLAEQGAHVIVSSRKIDGCQAVADAITAAGGSAANRAHVSRRAFLVPGGPAPRALFDGFSS